MPTSLVTPPNALPRGKTRFDEILLLGTDPAQLRAWLSVTPNWLRAAVAAIALLSVVFALAIRHASREQWQTIKTIRDDSAPSIVAGQGMRAKFADMHSDLANELLAYTPKEKEAAAKAFFDRREAGVGELLAAARNITYPGEVQPVRTVLQELPRYEEHAGRTRVLHDQANVKFLDEHQAADKIMRNSLLPAIDELIGVNQKELDTAYQSDATAATLAWQGVLWSGAGLLAAIVGLKFLLFKRMRRIVNLPLAAAAAVVAAIWLWALVALWQSSADIKSAKQDAFDSIKVLERARALAFDANGDESRWLLLKIHRGAADETKLYADAFREKAAAIVTVPEYATEAELLADIRRTQKAPVGSRGLLADELNNVTFAGEIQAATETLRTFLDYLAIDRRIRETPDERAAVVLCLGTQPGESDWAFEQFDRAIQKTIDINGSHFKSSLDDAESHVMGLDLPVPLGLALSVSVLAFLGLRPRLREYAV